MFTAWFIFDSNAFALMSLVFPKFMFGDYDSNILFRFPTNKQCDYCPILASSTIPYNLYINCRKFWFRSCQFQAASTRKHDHILGHFSTLCKKFNLMDMRPVFPWFYVCMLIHNHSVEGNLIDTVLLFLCAENASSADCILFGWVVLS